MKLTNILEKLNKIKRLGKQEGFNTGNVSVL